MVSRARGNPAKSRTGEVVLRDDLPPFFPEDYQTCQDQSLEPNSLFQPAASSETYHLNYFIFDMGQLYIINETLLIISF